MCVPACLNVHHTVQCPGPEEELKVQVIVNFRTARALHTQPLNTLFCVP